MKSFQTHITEENVEQMTDQVYQYLVAIIPHIQQRYGHMRAEVQAMGKPTSMQQFIDLGNKAEPEGAQRFFGECAVPLPTGSLLLEKKYRWSELAMLTMLRFISFVLGVGFTLLATNASLPPAAVAAALLGALIFFAFTSHALLSFADRAKAYIRKAAKDIHMKYIRFFGYRDPDDPDDEEEKDAYDENEVKTNPQW